AREYQINAQYHYKHCRQSFFFQAEDGIRDYKVTGVQTCALPISLPDLRYALHTSGFRLTGVSHTHIKPVSYLYWWLVPWMWLYKIGRASCRERVKISAVAGSLNSKITRQDHTE